MEPQLNKDNTGFNILIAALLLIGFAAILIQTLYPSTPDKTLYVAVPNFGTKETVIKEETVGLTSRILFTGDIYWGRGINLKAQKTALKEAYPFSRLNEFDRNKYDAWIGNLECPSVPGVNQPYNLEVEKLLFNCPSTYLPEAAKWFTAFSLANNHTANQSGQSGINATRAALQEQGIQYFGHYNPEIIEDICEVITIQTKILLNNGSEKVGSLPIALCGYHAVAKIPSSESLATIKEYAALMPVIVMPHMGVEYTSRPTQSQMNLYRIMIDNGADAVFGAHPHWVQPTEVYNNKLIVYSLGNFMFDQLPGESQRGAVMDLTLKTIGGVNSKTLDDWTAISSLCLTHQDSCLSQAESNGLTKLPFSFSYDALGVDMSNQLTKPASAELTASIKERLNWAEVSATLK